MTEPSKTISFASLGNSQQQSLFTFFNTIQAEKKADRLPALKTQFSGQNIPMNAARLVAIPALLATEPSLIPFMEPAQQEALSQDLLLAYFKLCSDYQYHTNENRRQHLKGLAQDIERCEFLLNLLRANEEERQVSLQAYYDAHQHAEKDFEFKRWFNGKLEKLRDISAGKTVYLRQWMADLNIWRLYSVWTGMLLGNVVNQIPTDFHNIQQTQTVLENRKLGLGYLSWLLWYSRFLINFTLLLKHTIRGPWMSEEEKNKPWQTRLQEQLQQRKFMLLNDIVWGTSNLVCFFWLVGEGLLGYLGNVLMVGLLIADVLITRWKFAEENQKHLEEMRLFREEIDGLNEQLEAIKQLKLTQDEIEHKTAVLNRQLQQLKTARDRCEREWNHQQSKQDTAKKYVVGVLLGYFITCSLLIPKEVIPLLSYTAMSMLGTSFLFLLSIAYNAYNANLDISKTKSLRKSALEECKAILSQEGPLSKADYIRFKTLESNALYQEKMAKYQEYRLYRKLLIESLVPFAIFTAFTFASFSLAVAFIATGVVLALASHYFLEKKKPKAPTPVPFDGNAYETMDKKAQLKSIDTALKPKPFQLFNQSKPPIEENTTPENPMPNPTL